MYTNEKSDRVTLYILATTFAMIVVSSFIEWPSVPDATRRFLIGCVLLNGGLIFIVAESYRLAQNLSFRPPTTFSGWVGFSMSAIGIYLFFEALFTAGG